MAPGARCLRVAMLNADTSVPNVYADLGTFGDILYRKLLAASGRTHDQIKITHSVYNVVMGEYPDSLDDLDAVFVTASAASSYEKLAWITKLEEYVVMLYKTQPQIKLFGSCFGHHIICQALLKDYGVAVAKRPGGWEIGVSEIKFTEEFREAFARAGSLAVEETSCLRWPGRLPTPESTSGEDDGKGSCSYERLDWAVGKSAYLEFVHSDEVVVQAHTDSESCSLPKPWVLLGTTEHCKVPGIYQPGRVFTLQGHFEFDTFKSQETVRIFGAGDSLASTKEPSDASETGKDVGQACEDGEAVVDMLLHFLTEDWAVTINRLACTSNEFLSAHADLPTP
jgi:GMP synthase-like glutamine amidotransferase